MTQQLQTALWPGLSLFGTWKTALPEAHPTPLADAHQALPCLSGPAHLAVLRDTGPRHQEIADQAAAQFQPAYRAVAGLYRSDSITDAVVGFLVPCVVPHPPSSSTASLRRAIIARMAIDARRLGERIRDARRRVDMSQEDLGRAVGLERTIVNKIETGVRRVAALELSDIATALDVRMSIFFEDPIPALVSHRSSQGLDTADSQIDTLLAKLASEVDFIMSLRADELGLDAAGKVAQAGITPPATNAEAEELAGRARALMGLSADEPIHQLSDRVASIGLLAFSRHISKDTADAGTILLPCGGVSLVNSHMKVGRRRLALAHELGHYLIADDYTIDWRVAAHSDLSVPMESRLDRFARALLLPEAIFSQKWREGIGLNEERRAAILLASEFRVDMATLATRLKELALAESETISAVRGFRTTQADIVEMNLRVPLEELSGTSVPRNFVLAVLRLVRDERISRDRALELLQGTFDEADLPQIRTRRPDEIWKFVS